MNLNDNNGINFLTEENKCVGLRTTKKLVKISDDPNFTTSPDLTKMFSKHEEPLLSTRCNKTYSISQNETKTKYNNNKLTEIANVVQK